MNLQKLKREIEHQTRNGRDEIYVSTEDAFELLKESSNLLYGKDRVYMPIKYLQQLVDNYEQVHSFRNSLKVRDVKTKITKIDEHGYTIRPIKDEER